MSVLLAMGIPTTADDRGYFLWLAQNWTMFVLPTVILLTLLIVWVIRKLRAWGAGTPGSANPPSAQSQTMPVPEQLNPPSGTQETRLRWAFGLQYCF